MGARLSISGITPPQDPERPEAYADEAALTRHLGTTPRTKIVTALLGESDHDLNVTQIAKLAGVHRTTVYDHLDDLIELGVVEETRTVGGSQMYRIDKESTVAEGVAQLEWDLLDVIADEE